MPAHLHQRLKESRPMPRIFLWILLGIFNVFLWLLLLAFHWEISMRARENNYFGTKLFPNAQAVPLPVIYSVCGLLTVASAAAILRDRSNLVARERIRILLLQILDSLSIGVVVLDDKDLLTMANDSARRLLPEIPPGYASLDILNVLEKRPGLRDIVKAATGRAPTCWTLSMIWATPQIHGRSGSQPCRSRIPRNAPPARSCWYTTSGTLCAWKGRCTRRSACPRWEH